MDTTVEVAVTGQYGSGVQVAVNDFLLDYRIQRTGHAVTGGAGITDNAEAELFQLRQQTGILQVQLGDFRTRSERGLDPRLAQQTQLVGLLRQQTGGHHVAWVGGVGAAGDGGDDHRAVGHQTFAFFNFSSRQFGFVGNPTLVQCRGRQAAMRVARASHVAHDSRQIKAQHPLVLGGDQRVGPQAGSLGVVLDQRHLLRLAAGQLEIIDGLLVDVEHRSGGTVLRAHVGNGRAVADRQAIRTCAEELDPGTDHTLLAQELGDRQDDVGGGNARLALASQLDTDDVGQAHHRRQTEHHGFRFQTANADGDHAQGIDVWGVRVGTHAGIREGHAAARLDHRAHLLQVNLVHDAVTGRNHVDVLERGLGPLDEVETVLVTTVFDGAVLGEGIRVEARSFHGQGVIDDQLGRHYRVDLGRISALLGNGITQAGQVDQRSLTEDVVADHARRVPGEVEVTLALDQLFERIGQRIRLAAAHQLLGQHARDVRQLGVGAGNDGIHRLAGIEEVQLGAGQRFAVGSIHGLGTRSYEVQGTGSAAPWVLISTGARPGTDRSLLNVADNRPALLRKRVGIWNRFPRPLPLPHPLPEQNGTLLFSGLPAALPHAAQPRCIPHSGG